MVRPHILLIWLAPLAAGCAMDRVAHVAPDESRPHLTWEIREGGEDERFVCGSADPSRECALVASTDERPNQATVRLFLHAAAADTSYLGLMTTPFLDGASQDREITITVPQNSRPVQSTVIGKVTTKPGAYSFDIALDATQQGMPAPARISHQVPVVVNAPPSSAHPLSIDRPLVLR